MKVPDSHIDLLTGDTKAVLTSMTPRGHPHSALADCIYEDYMVLIRLPTGSRHTRNMIEDPKVSVMVLDPEDDTRWLGVRGRVKSTEEVDEGFLFRIEPRRVIAFKDS
jgi:putative heme iron utilization protein